MIIDSTFAGKQTLVGKGAGALPTATAVLHDIERTLSQQGYLYHQSKSPLDAAGDNEVWIEVYIRYVETLPFKIPFDSVKEGYVLENERQAIGFIRLSDLKVIAPSLQEHGASIVSTGNRRIESAVMHPQRTVVRKAALVK